MRAGNWKPVCKCLASENLRAKRLCVRTGAVPAGTRALSELAGAVERDFGVGQEQAQKDVAQFLDEMVSVGLVQTCQPVAVTAIEMTATESTGIWETAGSR